MTFSFLAPTAADYQGINDGLDMNIRCLKHTINMASIWEFLKIGDPLCGCPCNESFSIWGFISRPLFLGKFILSTGIRGKLCIGRLLFTDSCSRYSACSHAETWDHSRENLNESCANDGLHLESLHARHVWAFYRGSRMIIPERFFPEVLYRRFVWAWFQHALLPGLQTLAGA